MSFLFAVSKIANYLLESRFISHPPLLPKNHVCQLRKATKLNEKKKKKPHTHARAHTQQSLCETNQHEIRVAENLGLLESGASPLLSGKIACACGQERSEKQNNFLTNERVTL